MSSLSPRLAIENRRFPLDSYLYHESIGVVLVGIPKVGCSTVKRWLIAMTDPAALLDPGLAVHKHSLEALALSRLSAPQAEEVLATRPIVAFVRQPLQRLRSAFVEKIVRPAPEDLFPPSVELLADWRSTHAALAEDGTDRRITFREFVEHIAAVPGEHLDPHWRPQADFLVPGPRTVLPLERLSESLDALARRLGRPDVYARPSNVTRKEPSRSGCLADVPAGVLHRADQRPPLSELADSALIARAMTALAADARLYRQALLTPNPWRAAAVSERYRIDADPPALPTEAPSRRPRLDLHAPTEHQPRIAAHAQGLPDPANAPRDHPLEH